MLSCIVYLIFNSEFLIISSVFIKLSKMFFVSFFLQLVLSQTFVLGWNCPEYSVDFRGNDLDCFTDVDSWETCGKKLENLFAFINSSD